MATIRFTAWGAEVVATLDISKYTENDNLAIQVTDHAEGFAEPYAVLTVNLSKKLPSNRAYVDTNNFPDAENFIIKNKLGIPTGHYRTSGYCTYPEYEFDLEEIKKYSSVE